MPTLSVPHPVGLLDDAESDTARTVFIIFAKDIADTRHRPEPLDLHRDGGHVLQFGEPTRLAASEQLRRHLAERGERDVDGVRFSQRELGRSVHRPAFRFFFLACFCFTSLSRFRALTVIRRAEPC